MTTTIVPRGSSLTSFYVNNPFDITFDISSLFTVAGASLQTCNSYPGLVPYVSNVSNFRGSFPSAGFKQYLQTDALFPTNDRAIWSVLPDTLSGSGNLVVDSSGRIYFGDTTDARILRTNLTGSYEVFAGQSSKGYTDGNRLTTATFTNPQGMAFDSNGNLYVGETANIRKIATDGTVSTFAGSPTGQVGYTDGSGTNCYFQSVAGMRTSNGTLILVDTSNHCVRRVTLSDAIVTTIAGGGTPATWVNSSSGCNASGTSGYLDATGTAARFLAPNQLTLTSSGDILVVDPNNFRIRKVTPSNVVTTYAGNGSALTLDGTRATCGFGAPFGIDRDASDTVYVSDNGYVIRRISGDSVTTFAGVIGDPRSVDGNLTTARFYFPECIRMSGNTLYIRERDGRLRAITPPTEVSPFVNRPAGYTLLATQSYPITVTSRIDVCWTSVGGVLPLYKFEPFSASFTANGCGGITNDTLTYSATDTELLGYLSGTGTSNVLFRASNGPSVAYTYPLTLLVRATSNSVPVEDVSTTVTIGTARIVYSPCNASVVFYRNEPIAPIVFSLVASDLSLLYSATTLPTGLSFARSGSQSFTLSGTPTIQSITSNYTILGFDTKSRTYATQVSLAVNPERLLLDVSGSLVQSNLGSNVAIQPITFTARFPPYGSPDRSMLYTWSPAPPGGLAFRKKDGSVIYGTSYSVAGSSDASFTLTLSGTLTSAALRDFAFSNKSGTRLTLTGARTYPLPSLSPSLPQTIDLSFAETVFFDSSTQPLYVGLNVSNYVYTAKTYFPSPVDTSITSIAVTDGYLPDGLDGSFTFVKQQFALRGTPTTATTYPFTLTATNGAGTTASLSVAPTVLPDSVTITPLSDSCFNFIQYRSLSAAKAGFYPFPIRYSVTSASGLPVTLTGANLPAGVEIVSNTGTYDLSGRPTMATGSSLATLTARVPATGVSNTTTFRYSVSAETFSFSSPTFSFIQNVPITPVQIDVSTFSEVPVLRFSSPNLPDALQITNTGRIFGTVRGSSPGSFDVTAFTAYSSGTKSYTYTLTPDKVLLQPAVYRTVTAPGKTVSIPITGYSLSAVTVSNYRFQDPFSYGLAINSTSGLLSGTLAASLPASTTFTLLGSAGLVTGSLVGTMTTNNLTVNRAQILRNDFANYFPANTTLRVYSSDTNGASWTKRFDASENLYASMIATNSSNVYLIPTSSNVVLKSTDTVFFSSNVYDDASNSPHATSIVNKPGTSTWWMVGTKLNPSSDRKTFLWTTSNDGATWTSSEITGTGFTARDKHSNSALWSPYVTGGAALAYKNGVLLVGGTCILRSTDEGQTWSSVTGGFTKEVGFFALDHPTVWVATGSDTYETVSNAPWNGTTAKTICYSLDAGLSWTFAANGFNMNGYGVVYAGAEWMAYGLCNVYPSYSLYTMVSFDAVNWQTVTAVGNAPGSNAGMSRPDALRMTIAFDETDWKVFVPSTNTTVTMYTHAADTPLFDGWASLDVTSAFPGFSADTILSSYTAQLIDPGADVTTITFSPPNTGPTFISPAQTTYVVWQYMPIPTISFTATGTAPISYFVSRVPTGLTWNSTTHSLSGSCVRTGTQSLTIYAVDGVGGVTAFTIVFICDIPRIVKQQTGAGAYTALVRDYTEVAAAINARDTRVNPVENAALGAFAAPYPPDVVTPSNCPC